MDTVLLVFWILLDAVIGASSALAFLSLTLLYIRFCIPFTIQLQKLGCLLNKVPLLFYTINVIALPLLFLLVAWLVHTQLEKGIIGFWIGVAFILYRAWKTTGITDANFMRYLKANMSCLDMLQHEQVFAYIAAFRAAGNFKITPGT